MPACRAIAMPARVARYAPELAIFRAHHGVRVSSMPVSPSSDCCGSLRLHSSDMRCRTCGLVVALIACASTGRTSTLAQRLESEDNRPAIEAPGLVFDEARQRPIMFGGGFGAGLNDATWEYDGRSWLRIQAPGPSRRNFHAMVYDRDRRKVVLFGGGGPGAVALGDTWEYDGARWTERVLPGPSPRHSAGFAYDARRGLTVVFGGIGAEGVLGDTWGWDGTRWARLADAGPDPRALAAMAYDKARDRIVLFGGRKGWPDDLADTWLWDGSSWSRVH